MPQIPALFLPKKKTEENTQSKNLNKNRKKKESDKIKKVSALVQGRIDGHKKNDSQIRIGAIAG